MTLSQIEASIACLPSHDLAALMRWMGEFVATKIGDDLWDKKIAADSASGKLDAFFDDAIKHANSGLANDL